MRCELCGGAFDSLKSLDVCDVCHDGHVCAPTTVERRWRYKVTTPLLGTRWSVWRKRPLLYREGEIGEIEAQTRRVTEWEVENDA